MINRVLIRLKIIQIVYAYYRNGGKNVDAAEKELFFSLSKAYDLYNYLLLLMVSVTNYAARRIEQRRNKLRPNPEDLNPNMKFVQNRFIAQLESNTQLAAFVSAQKKTWENETEFLKSLLEKIEASPAYSEYMQSPASSYDEDRELWRKLYKTLVVGNEELDELLEEQSLYWNDDKETVDTFVLKTIKRFDEANGADQELLPQFKDEEDRQFASRLLRATIQDEELCQKLVSENIRNWEVSRLAFMDVVIMQAALAEILTFPNIPVTVSLNEYVEIAKYYSTPKSSAFINGLLDTVVSRLRSSGKITKE